MSEFKTQLVEIAEEHEMQKENTVTKGMDDGGKFLINDENYDSFVETIENRDDMKIVEERDGGGVWTWVGVKKV